ncbi:tryptophan-rich sensory protein [Candidatus Nomurabacteria bacterium]|nr:tryptophan-rich sensory protein [Candidatus Nomurabacteria bacterium]
MKIKIKSWPKLLLSIIICQGAGLLGSVFTTSEINAWYRGIIKPSFNPPNWIFGPVWTLLFLLMGFALYLIWQEDFKKKKVQLAWAIFIGQLVLNVFWSVLFFGLHNPGAAFVEIIILWLAILTNIYYFYQVKKTAAYLLLPYILWVSFAAILNFAIWQLN